MTISIRTFSAADLHTADVILASAFQRVESWLTELRLFRRLQPDGLFLASVHGTPAGMVAAINYSKYAYIGLMGVHQEFQRQGLGLALMEHVLAWACEQRIPLVKLDASKAGQPLYEKMGFVPLDEVYVFLRQIGQLDGLRSKEVQIITPQHLDLITASDSQAFGADRGRLLRALLELYSERAFMLRGEKGQVNGFLFAQAKRLGPWIMQENGDAEQLLLAALSLPFSGTVSVVTPAGNADAVHLLQRYGFQVSRVNRQMAYGPGWFNGQREKIYGQTSLSFG